MALSELTTQKHEDIMNHRPNIIISSLDLERIENLLDALPEPEFAKHSALLEELSRADVVEPQSIPPTVVTMNSTVRFVMNGSDAPLCATLVYPKDMNGEPDRISVLAPIGTALLGMQLGEEIEWIVPNGDKISVRVTEIVYQPERAGVLHR